MVSLRTKNRTTTSELERERAREEEGEGGERREERGEGENRLALIEGDSTGSRLSFEWLEVKETKSEPLR